jgi:hypothetical protein
MDIRPFVTMKSEEIILKGLSLTFWNHKSQQKTQNRDRRNIDKKRDINEILQCILFQNILLYAAKE